MESEERASTEGNGAIRDHVKNAMRDIKKNREIVIASVELLANLYNKKSYFSESRVQSALGSIVSPTALTLDIDNDIFHHFSLIHESQSKVLESIDALEKLTEETQKSSSSAAGFDLSYLNQLIPQLKQQYLLEKSVVSALAQYNEHNADQDALVSMVACFKYPPYLRESDITHVLHL